jgi:hypothetical protein
MMKQITRIEPFPLAMMLAILGFFAGLILGFAAMAMSASADSIIYMLPLFGAENISTVARSLLTSLGPFSIVIFALLFSLEGFIGGFIGAMIYNLAAARFGGVAFTAAEQAVPQKPVQQQAAPAAEAQPGTPAGGYASETSGEGDAGYQNQPETDGSGQEEVMKDQSRRRAPGVY